jgi:hypothetical protein
MKPAAAAAAPVADAPAAEAEAETKDDIPAEFLSGTLISPPQPDLLANLRIPPWFSALGHCSFSA